MLGLIGPSAKSVKRSEMATGLVEIALETLFVVLDLLA